MKNLLFFFLLVCNFLHSYSDDELDQLWSSISDINNPKLVDYQLVENYLKNGTRPYLDALHKSIPSMGHAQNGCQARINRIYSFKLIGLNNEMPIFETYSFNAKYSTDSRCIVLYSSYNGIYPEKAQKALSDLRQSGYSGHVLLRIGGFPNTANGGLKMCYIPYAFKIAFLREAQLLGYKEILWIDTAIHPLTNLESVFNEIKEKGYFFTSVCSLKGNGSYHLLEAANSLNITEELYDQIPHIATGIIGFNIENRKAAELLESWYIETEKVYPNITWFPEELSLSVAAWRLNCRPSTDFGSICCGEHELISIHNRPTLQFYLDAAR